MWTAEVKQRLIVEWNERKRSASQIADLFGPPFTRNSIIAKVWRMRRDGVPMRFTPNNSSRVASATFARRRAAKAAQNQSSKQGPKPITFGLAEPPPPLLELKPDTGEPKIRDISKLENDHCKWPYGEPGTPDFGWCGEERVATLPYCATHCQRAFRPPFLHSHPELKKFAPQEKILEPAE